MRKASSQPKHHPQEISLQNFVGFEAPLLHAGLVLLQTKKTETWKPVSYRSILAGTYVTAVDLQGDVVGGIELFPSEGHAHASLIAPFLGAKSLDKVAIIQGLVVREDFLGTLETSLISEITEQAIGQGFEVCFIVAKDERLLQAALASGFLRVDGNTLALPVRN